MIKKLFFIITLVLGLIQFGISQTINNTLIKADKLFIKHEYVESAKHYEHYLKSFPKDYYASRQAAICYKKTNNQALAIDHWPNVIDANKVTDSDRLEYAKCLLANYRTQDAKMMINFLRNSSDKSIAAWGMAYANTDQFYMDSASTKVNEVVGVNTKESESCPVLMNDKLVFVTEKNKVSRVFVAKGNDNKCILNIVTKKDELHFMEGKLYAHLIQNKGLNSQISLSPDETTMYYSKSVSSKKLNAVGETMFYKFQIYSGNPTSEKSEVATSFQYNSADYDCMHPSISKDGLKLYFASDMKGTLGGKDIFVCEWMNGAWGVPKNLGPSVNTSGDEVYPHITDDNILFFASDTKPGLGGLDLFYSISTLPDGSFLPAKNLGTPINSQFDDYSIFILKGGKAGYFSSNRKNNLQDDDIYYFVKEQQ